MGHLGQRAKPPDAFLEENHPMTISSQFWKGTTQGSFQQSFVEIGSVVSEEKISFKFHPLFSIFSLVAILVGSQDHRTQFWKGATQGSFQQSFVEIGSVVSEEKIKMLTDGRRTKSDGNSSHGPNQVS